jgi:hypothetical protein
MSSPSRREVAYVAAIYLLLTVVMTWPYVNYAAFGTSSYGGDQRLIIWTLAWDNHAVLSGAKLFDSNLFFPFPDSLRYNEHLFGVSLFSLPLALAGASPVLAHNVLLWLSFPLNGLAAFLLIRRFTGMALPAFVGSLAFTFPFYVMAHANGHLHLVWLWPIPLSLLLLERWFDRPTLGRLAGWAAIVLLEAISSWYLAVLVLIVNGLMGLVLLATSRTPAWGRRVSHLVLAAVLLGAGVYPFARHYTELQGTAGEIAANSAQLDSYLVPPRNTMVGQWWTAHVNHLPREIWGEQTLFAGWIALALAVIGIAVLARARAIDRRAWVFAAIAFVCALLSFGPALTGLGATHLAPYTWIGGLPGLSGMRAPARFASVVMLGVAGLAGIAGVGLVRRFGMAGRIVLVALVPLMLAEWYVVAFPAGKPRPFPIPAIYRTQELRAARSLVSLPDYWGTTDWVLGGDYLYFSTAHWRPILNGFGRTAPRGYDDVLATVRAFPASAPAMRALGIQYVVLHAARYPDRGAGILHDARMAPGVRLAGQIDSDYLFELIDAR